MNLIPNTDPHSGFFKKRAFMPNVCPFVIVGIARTAMGAFMGQPVYGQPPRRLGFARIKGGDG